MARPLVCLTFVVGLAACDDFSSPSAPADAGTALDASPDSAPPLPDAGDAGDGGRGDSGPKGSRRVFVTSKVTVGDMTFGGATLGGVAEADAECQREADAARLAGDFIAFLPTATQSARERFDQPTRNLVLVNNAIIANGFGSLFGSGPSLPIALAANSTSVSETETVYTGTLSLGGNSAANCGFWATTVANGSYGSLGKAADWVSSPTQANTSCSTPRRIYCFER